MIKKHRNLIVALNILIFLAIATVTYADQYKPYMHKPDVPEDPNLDLQGSYKTDLFPGAATYSFGIEVPPGTNGLQPMLAVFYNSHMTNSRPGLLGTGWSFTQNYISRDTEHTFDSSGDDTFKLVLNGRSYDLVYSSVDGRYHTKFESYLKIEMKSGAPNTYGQYWLVTEKDGTKYRFGYNHDSELVSNLYSYTVKWSLDSIEDTHQNKIYYSYQENPYPNDLGAVYPYQIKYNNDQTRIIEFIYETSDRPDKWKVYENGNLVRESRRLQEIQVKLVNDLVRKYVFDYTTIDPGSRTLLNSITTYGSDGTTSLPPITFSYNPVTKGWQEAPQWISPLDFGTEEDEGVRIFDINNDGLSDLYQVWEEDDEDYYDEVYLSNENGWSYGDKDKWIECIFYDTYSIIGIDGIDYGVRMGDLNGDGRDDILKCFDSDEEAYINTGTTFLKTSNWDIPTTEFCFVNNDSGDIENEGVRLVDVNGDGKADLVKGRGDDIKTKLNTGSSFETDFDWDVPYPFITNSGEDEGIRLADVNGDGLVDFLRGEGSDHRDVYLNTGDGWELDTSWQIPYQAYFVDESDGDDNGVRLADINGDGLTDIIRCQEFSSSDKNYAWINTGSGWVEDLSWQVPSLACFAESNGDNNGVRLADINGDGIADLLYRDYRTWISKAEKPYLLNEITAEFGGTTSIDYKKSTYLDNKDANGISQLGFNLWIVDNSIDNNQMPGSHNLVSQQSYDYSGGVYDTDNEEFTGFKFVEETNPDDTIIKHWFYQEYPRRGLEEKTEILDQSGNPYKIIEYGWSSTPTNGYYVTKLDYTTENIHDGQINNPKSSRIDYSYDSYGNIVETNYEGEIGLSGDEKKETFDYAYNTTYWIVDKPYHYKLYDNDLTTVFMETFYQYDNQAYGQYPIKGDLTREENWLDSGINPVITYRYNSYGNIVSATNPEGHTTYFDYGIRDTTYTFLDREKNDKGHETNYYYDEGTGNLLKQTDPNGYATEYQYDVFGRKTKEIIPYDSVSYPTKKFTYSIDGSAPEKIIVSQIQEAGTSSYSDTHYFYDGFGKIVQIKQDSEDNKQVIGNIFYNPNYEVNKTANPYFKDSSASYAAPDLSVPSTSYVYDPIGRLTIKTNPDSTQSSYGYDHLKTTVTNENGNSIDYLKDVYGRIASIVEKNNGENYVTNYYYDVSGNLMSILDSFNEEIIYNYDSLGRKINEQDNDLGLWAYDYDKNGNIIEFTDSRSKTIYYSYDSLNRLTDKAASDHSISYTYDNGTIGTLSSVQSPDFKLSYDYDQRLRITSKEKIIDSISFVTEYEYDSADNIISKKFPDNSLIEYAYNNQNQINSISGILSDITYDSFGSPTNIDYLNGLSKQYSHNLQNHRIERINTESFQDLNYNYDNVGNIVEIYDPIENAIEVAQYDDLDRLIQSSKTKSGLNIFNFQYNYDSIGNMMEISGKENSVIFNYGNKPEHSPLIIQIGEPIQEDGPEIKILNPVNNMVYNVPSIDLNWTSKDELEWCAYSLDGAANVTAICDGSWSYQETADIISCPDGQTWAGDPHNCTQLYDGNWSSYAYAQAQPSYMFANYTKPAGSLNSSVWMIKNETGMLNVTIPTLCWNQNPLQFYVMSKYAIPSVPIVNHWACKNGITSADWQVLAGSQSNDVPAGHVYEEAIWWNIILQKNITLIDLSEGSHNITIYGNDSDGNMKQSDYIYFTVETITTTTSISLNQGWNLISIPLISQNQTVSYLLNSIEGNYSKIFSYVDNNWIELDGDSKVNGTMGLWIKMNNSDILELEGTIPENVAIDLGNGWNLIGYTGDSTNVTQAVDSIDGCYSYIFTYWQDEWYSFNPLKSWELNSLKNMTFGKGYWIKINCTEVYWTIT